MLCLTVRRGERIIIYDNIIIEILREGSQTRVGIIAPRKIPIAREKVFTKLHPDIQLPPAMTRETA